MGSSIHVSETPKLWPVSGSRGDVAELPQQLPHFSLNSRRRWPPSLPQAYHKPARLPAGLWMCGRDTLRGAAEVGSIKISSNTLVESWEPIFSSMLHVCPCGQSPFAKESASLEFLRYGSRSSESLRCAPSKPCQNGAFSNTTVYFVGCNATT